MVAPALAANAVALAAIVCRMTSTAAVGATSAGRATLIVRVERRPGEPHRAQSGAVDEHHRRDDRDAEPTFDEPQHRIHLRPSSTTSGVRPAERNAASVALRRS